MGYTGVALVGMLLALSLLATLAHGQATTPFIQQVFIGKCYEKNPTGADCQAMWDAFSPAAQLGNNVVNDSDYAPFFALSNFSTPKSGILFWSGNQAFALAMSNNVNAKYTTVEGTSTGYILNGLSWCGIPNADPPQFDYTDNCLYPSNSTYYGTQGVWAQCSKRFAQGASGSITVLLQPAQLNFNSGPYLAFRNTSVFYQVEMPNINASQVESVTILLLKNKTTAPDEACSSGSLLTLEDEMTKKFGFKPSCIDDPQEIYKLLCPDKSTVTAQCLAATLAYSDSGLVSVSNERKYLAWALSTTMTTAATVVLAAYFALRVRTLTSSNSDSYTYLK